MLKKSICAAFAAVLLVGSYVGYKSMVTNEEFSDLELANIEALADSESEPVYAECPGGKIECARIVQGHTTHLFYKESESESE